MKPIIVRVLLLIMVTLPTVSTAQVFGPSFKISTGFTLLPRGERDWPDITYKEGKFTAFDLEYTYFHDAHSYYSAYYYGFTTGLKYQKSVNTLSNIYTFKESSEEIQSISIPILLANKRSEWNDHFRFGLIGSYDINRKATPEFVWNTRPYHLDLYLSFGFDNLNPISRHLTDGWMWTIELTGQYSLLDYIYKGDKPNHVRLLKVGGKIGIVYQFDYYHYRKWYNNY